ncbi:MAG: transglutaminase domain-containing protein [Saprospiraceae bacterium]
MVHLFAKKALFTFSLFAFPLLAFSQNTPFSKVDEYTANFDQKFVDIPTLATQLTEPFESDLEKSRALFMWIAHHVRYDCRKFHKPKGPTFRASTKEELDRKIEEWRKREVIKTAKSKTGICEDYSRLFKALCDEVGLEAVVIVGNARDFYKPYRRAHNNSHAWNAVKIDGQWRLLDATWAAGHVNPEVTKFTREIKPGYFMPDPAWLGQTHFPDEEKWQLSAAPLDKKSFPKQPMINFGQNDFPILDFSKSIADTNEKKYDKEIRIKMENKPKHFMVASQKRKPIQFSQSTEDGYEVFRFSSSGARDIVIFCGNNERQMDWLARYDL